MSVENLRAIIQNISLPSFYLILILILISLFILYLYKKLSKKYNDALYCMDIIRTISKAINNNHQEIAVFDETGNVIFSTKPSLYFNKEDFLKNMLSEIMSSDELSHFYNCILSNKNANVILGERVKVLATNAIITEDDSLLGENINVVTLSDVSKHFGALEKSFKNQEKLEQFLDDFPFGIFYLNSSGIIVGTNTTFANLIKTSKDRLIGIAINDFISDFKFNDFQKKIGEYLVKPKFSANFKASITKIQSSSKNGSQAWVISKIDEPNVSGEFNENFLKQGAFTCASIPSIITDTSGKIKAINPAFAAMIQDKVILEKDKMMKPGENILEFISNKTASKDITEHLKASFLSQKENTPIEIKFSGGDITTMAYISRIENLSNSTEKKSQDLILIQLTDISSLKKLEQQFIQSQKMQAVGQLAGGIAHDFNNLLTAMIGFCDLLLQRYTQNDPSYGDVVQIKQNAGRAASLVRQLLAFSRQQTLKPKVVSVTEVLVDISSLLKRLIGSNIDFQVVHGRDLWPVKVDNGQFEQVIINLAVNARDAMNNSGKLIIRTKNYYADKEFKCIYDTAHAGDYVLIEVIDTGCGIEPEIVENIFEPFFSRKSSDIINGTGSGTGLGLSTVYGIVNQTGGYINVISEVGVGATFQIYLPRYVGNEQIQNTLSESINRDLSGTETILLVEDEDPVRMFSSRALRDKGYKVIEACCGEDALKIAETEKFDLLVTDVVMPKIDGPTLNKRLREKIPDIKTIFISGYTEDAFRQDLDKNSNIHFLQKPFTLKDLATKVKEVISCE